jgi:hypothetical protein
MKHPRSAYTILPGRERLNGVCLDLSDRHGPILQYALTPAAGTAIVDYRWMVPLRRLQTFTPAAGNGDARL